MRRQDTLILCVAFTLALVLIIPFTGPRAQAHDARGGDCCSNSRIVVNFPPTDDAEVAKIYATAHIVSVYLQNSHSVKDTQLDDIVNWVEEALEN